MRTVGKATDLITFSRSSGGTALRKIAYGPELVTNGTFDSDSDWTLSAGATISSSQLNIDYTVGTNGASQTLSISVGKIYQVSVDVSGTGSARLEFGGSITVLSNGTNVFSFVTTSTDVLRVRNHVNFIGSIDNISVKEVLFDQGDLTLFNHPADIPRIEYDANGNVLGLLVEESRTNLITYSDMSGNVTVAGATVSANVFTGVDGVTSAATLIEDSSTGVHRFTTGISPTITSGIDYTASIYAKANGRDEIRLTENATTGAYATFNVSTGSIVGSGLGGSGVIESAGNGWYRCSLTFTSAGTFGRIDVNLSSGGSISYAGDDTSGVYVYGWQLEAGAFPTSYIPTSGSTATRAADVASIATSEFGYRDDEGTVVVEVTQNATSTTGAEASGMHDTVAGGASSLVRIKINNSISRSQLTVYDSTGALVVDMSNLTPLTVQGQSKRIGIGLEQNNFALVSNGGTVATDTSGGMPNPNILILGRYPLGGSYLNGHIKSIKYIPRRITNDQLQEITS